MTFVFKGAIKLFCVFVTFNLPIDFLYGYCSLLTLLAASLPFCTSLSIIISYILPPNMCCYVT